MTVRIVRADALRPRPWPNGHGITRDIAGETAPDGRPAWLLSLAELARDAPFSHFPEADRVFTLCSGDPIELVVDDGPPMLCRPLLPTHFPGDRPTRARVAGGPGTAFNVFGDRRRFRVDAAALNLAAGHGAPTRGAAVSAVHCVGGTAAIGPDRLGPGDTWIGPAGVMVAAVDGPAILVLAAVDPAPGDRSPQP